MGEKNNKVANSNFQFVNRVSNEFVRPGPGKREKICGEVHQPKFCVVQDYMRPRRLKHNIQLPSVVEMKKGDSLYFTFRADREILLKNNENEVVGMYDFTAHRNRDDTFNLRDMSVSVELVGRDSYKKVVFDNANAEVNYTENNSTFIFGVKVKACKDISFCDIEYSLFWRPYQLIRKDMTCDCDGHGDVNVKAHWPYNVCVYFEAGDEQPPADPSS